MKTFEDLLAEFESGKEYSRQDIKEIMEVFGRYNKTMRGFIEYAEKVFLLTGEICSYDASSLCKACNKDAQ